MPRKGLAPHECTLTVCFLAWHLATHKSYTESLPARKPTPAFRSAGMVCPREQAQKELPIKGAGDELVSGSIRDKGREFL